MMQTSTEIGVRDTKIDAGYLFEPESLKALVEHLRRLAVVFLILNEREQNRAAVSVKTCERLQLFIDRLNVGAESFQLVSDRLLRAHLRDHRARSAVHAHQGNLSAGEASAKKPCLERFDTDLSAQLELVRVFVGSGSQQPPFVLPELAGNERGALKRAQYPRSAVEMGELRLPQRSRLLQ